jgi:hypothetical protein
MGFRFRKSISLGKGTRLNFSGKSIGISAGIKGARISLNSRGRLTKSVGIPGTGMSYVSSSNISDGFSNEQSDLPENSGAPAPQKKGPGGLKIFLWIAAIILGLALFPFLWIIAPIPAVVYFIKSQNPKKTRNVIITAAVCVLSLVGFTRYINSSPQDKASPAAGTSATRIEAESATSETAKETEKTETASAETTTTAEATTAASSAAAETTSEAASAAATQAADESSGPHAISVLGDTTVKAGDVATLTIQGEPDTQYEIEVYYSSGRSKAEGLEPKTSDADGKVSWSWKVGTKTAPGTYKIIISGNGQKQEVPFTVT